MDLKKISGAAFFGLAVVACLAVMSTHQVEEVKYDYSIGGGLTNTEDDDTAMFSDSAAPSASSRLFDDAVSDDGDDEDDSFDATSALHPSLSGLSGLSEDNDDQEDEEEDSAAAPAGSLDDFFSTGNSNSQSEEASSSSDESLSDGDDVTVQYRLRKPDGSEIATQWGDGDGGDFSFTVGGGHVIPGFDQVVSGMSVGQTVHDVTVPADQAYGSKGGPMGIGPDQDLVYDIRVVKKN